MSKKTNEEKNQNQLEKDSTQNQLEKNQNQLGKKQNQLGKKQNQLEKNSTQHMLSFLKKAEEAIMKRYQATRYENWRVAHLCLKQGNEQIEKALLYEKQIAEKRKQLAESANEISDFSGVI